MFKIKFIHIRMIIYIISVVLVVIIVKQKLQIPCYFLENYGIICPACGLTRATISIVNLDFESAVKYNKYYTLILVPLLIILVLNDIYIFIKRELLKKRGISFIEIIFGDSKLWKS